MKLFKKFLFLFFVCVLPLAAQAKRKAKPAQPEPTITRPAPPEEAATAEPAQEEPTYSPRNCSDYPYMKGCWNLVYGPMLGLEDGKFIFGVYGMANYFIRERLALGGRIYALFPENLQYYTVGATIQYFIGPVVLNTLIVPGFTFARLFVRGEVTSDGHSYAPMVGFIWRSGGNFYYGISYNRTTYVYGGLSVTRTEFLPIFFYTF